GLKSASKGQGFAVQVTSYVIPSPGMPRSGSETEYVSKSLHAQKARASPARQRLHDEDPGARRQRVSERLAILYRLVAHEDVHMAPEPPALVGDVRCEPREAPLELVDDCAHRRPVDVALFELGEKPLEVGGESDVSHANPGSSEADRVDRRQV